GVLLVRDIEEILEQPDSLEDGLFTLSPSLSKVQNQADKIWESNHLGNLKPPPSELLVYLKTLAEVNQSVTALFCHHEKGDLLYDQVSWVFDYKPATREIHGTSIIKDAPGECIYFFAKEGFSKGSIQVEDLDEEGDEPLGCPMARLLYHLDVVIQLCYFPPDDDPTFDWEAFRIPY
ncbi:MAG: hypothetical protein AAFU64_13760, partial [Bacteroidota bacterium]